MTIKLSSANKESLLGPAVVGVVCGIFAALATVAFNSDYGLAAYRGSPWPLWAITTAQALTAFAVVAAAVFAIFGVVPVMLSRIGASGRSDV